MTKRLSQEDRKAVDLLLDRTLIGSDGNGGSFVSHATIAPQARLESVERVLRVLEAMPAPEPSADLIERTMQRIAGDVQMPIPTRPASVTNMDQPHA